MTVIDRRIALVSEEAARLRRRDRLWKIGLVWGLLVALTAALIALPIAVENRARADQAQAEKRTLKADILQECQDPEFSASPAGQSLCSLAEAPDDQSTGSYDLPSVPEIIAAKFRAYCAQGNCRGADGATPTPAQLAAIFADYCATTGECRGADGAAVTPEMTLAAVTAYCSTGVCRGTDGQPATTEQITSAVTAFCADGRCRGEPGPPGTAGPPGEPGAPGQAPESFSFTDQAGTTYRCTPDPPGTTTYQCAPQTQSTQTP